MYTKRAEAGSGKLTWPWAKYPALSPAPHSTTETYDLQLHLMRYSPCFSYQSIMSKGSSVRVRSSPIFVVRTSSFGSLQIPETLKYSRREKAPPLIVDRVPVVVMPHCATRRSRAQDRVLWGLLRRQHQEVLCGYRNSGKQIGTSLCWTA